MDTDFIVLSGMSFSHLLSPYKLSLIYHVNVMKHKCSCSSCVVQVRSGCVTGVQPSRAMKSQHSPENAARERSRVRNLRQAFHSLQAALPSVPRDTKLSKLDVLVLATDYIAHLTETLDQGGALSELKVPPRAGGYLHPVKKWPMRSLLYCGSVGALLSANQKPASGEEETNPLTPTPEVDMDQSV
uniref:Transcription factor 23-like n=2 Tax=Salmo trutta TaxID=8032 RepID=A0A673X786_SALTR